MIVGLRAPLLAGLVLSLATPAVARVVTVNAGGTVASAFSAGGGSTSVLIGSAMTLTFSFDTDMLELIGSNPTSAGYRFTPIGLNARIGDYLFVPAGAVGTVSFARGFSFFGGSSSEAVLNQTFAFGGIGEGAPFSFATGTARTNLIFTSVFRYGFDTPPIDLSALTDPASAARGSFSFAGFPASGVARASVDGAASGSFVTAGVPEPATWSVMLLGFGAVGYAMRRRPRVGAQLSFG